MKRKVKVCLIALVISGAVMYVAEQFIANLLGGAGMSLGFPFSYYTESWLTDEPVWDQPLIRVLNFIVILLPVLLVVNSLNAKKRA